MGSKSGPEMLAAKPAISPLPIVSRGIRRGPERSLKLDLAPERSLTGPVHEPAPAPDQVRIAVLVLDALGPASMRASYSGKEVRVAVPDATIAAIFRAAIAETSRARSTDRLIRVVID